MIFRQLLSRKNSGSHKKFLEKKIEKDEKTLYLLKFSMSSSKKPYFSEETIKIKIMKNRIKIDKKYSLVKEIQF